ncbi:terpenoid synthase [Lentinus tigrinus ALCF2SS1-7]|uniref:Terpene synthase n=1 Tax=Lentinus tigrinus ALCF2SS1-6 TaxID=1328759 RepID=A0A5C2RVU8_9APHY|nr:terpenoid synthase [Lentinus tigrinus ALCF2SS1-6]RPD76766.1 terpenoid synthase [Lentinus tigrinus ALCF2SS1-7]
MSVKQLRPFPSHFRLRDLTTVTDSVFELKVNPHQDAAARETYAWFDRCNVYQGKMKKTFLSHRFDLYAALSFPEADLKHLETCIAFFLWTFSFDDLSDEGALQNKPQAVQTGVDISMEVLRNPDAPVPNFPYAVMLSDIWKTMRTTASTGACNRFFRAVESWMAAQVEQATFRKLDEIPSVNDFIILRRRTIGARIVEAMVEYSLDLQIPEYVWDDPILQEMSKAWIDIMTWPNDLCSFNKEQADDDFQNLVFCIMIEHDCDLQTAIDTLTDMLAQRVTDYVNLRAQLRSFGPDVDREVARYTKAMEQYTQGTLVWYYHSPRYFRGQDVLNKPEIVVPVYERTAPAEPEPEPAPSAPSAAPYKASPQGSTLASAMLFALPRGLVAHQHLASVLVCLVAVTGCMFALR